MKLGKSVILALSSSLVLGLISGCGGGGGDSETTLPTATQTIDASGGVIELSSGFKVTFPEGAVEESIQVSVAETSAPAALPSGIEAVSPAYAINASVDRLKLTAELQFPGGGSYPYGTVSVYRWDDVEKQWKIAGGSYSEDDDAVKTQVNGFSPYILGKVFSEEFGVRRVEFIQDNNIPGFDVPMTVFVNQYELAYPIQNPRLATETAVVVYSSPTAGGIFEENSFTLPQGRYSFCADWWVDSLRATSTNPAGWHRRYAGALPDNPAAILTEAPTIVNAPVVDFGSVVAQATEQLGVRCDAPKIFIAAGDAEEFDFVGTYNAIAIEPPRTYESLHATFLFEPDHSLKMDQWVEGVYSSGTGTWQFDSSTDTFSFSVDGGSSFSGVVSGNTDSFDLSGTWDDGTPGITRLTRP